MNTIIEFQKKEINTTVEPQKEKINIDIFQLKLIHLKTKHEIILQKLKFKRELLCTNFKPVLYVWLYKQRVQAIEMNILKYIKMCLCARL